MSMASLAMVERIRKQQMALYVAQLIVQEEVARLEAEGDLFSAHRAEDLQVVEATLAEIRRDLQDCRADYEAT